MPIPLLVIFFLWGRRHEQPDNLMKRNAIEMSISESDTKLRSKG